MCLGGNLFSKSSVVTVGMQQTVVAVKDWMLSYRWRQMPRASICASIGQPCLNDDSHWSCGDQ